MFSNWMSYIKDDTKITQLVIPGAHNAGSYGMSAMACCQDDNLYTQFQYGIRQFCLRLDTNRNGRIVLAHGITKGDRFRHALQDIKKILEENDSEILLLDIREYYPQKLGLVTLRYRADPIMVNDQLWKYINPEKYAYTDFDDISEVTIGDIRKAGKRYILINDDEAYKFSKNCKQVIPWDKQRNGSVAEKYAKEAPKFFDEVQTDGLYWFQTQQTPNLGTEIGVKTPRELDDDMRKYFCSLIDKIADTPRYLERANIIAGDFMTKDYMKVKSILRLNLLKHAVKDECIEAYEELVK